MAEELNRKEIEELRRLINLLEKDIKGIELENLLKSAGAARALLISLRKESQEFTSDVSQAAAGFRKVVEEIRKTDQGLNLAGKSFNKLASIADKVQYHLKEISKLSLKEVETLKKQAEQEKTRLNTANELISEKISRTQSYINSIQRELDVLDRNLEKNGDLSDADYARYDALEKRQKSFNKELIKQQGIQNEIGGTLENQNFLYNSLVSSLDKINKELEEEKELLGLGGAAIGGISKALDKLGLGGLSNQLGLDEAKEKMEETAKKIRLAGEQLESNLVKEEQLRKNINALNSESVSLVQQINESTNTSVLTQDKLKEITEKLNQLKAKGDKANKDELTYYQKHQKELEEKLNLERSIIEELQSKNKIIQDNIVAESKELEILQETNKVTANTNGKFEVMKAGLSSMKDSILKNLKDPLVVVGFVIAQLIDALKLSDKATGDLAKDFNITYEEAGKVREELTTIGNLSGDISVNTRALQESMVAIGKRLGSNAMLNEKDLVTFTKLVEKAGFAKEEIAEIERLTLATGGNLDDNVKNLMYSAKITGLNNKVLLNEKDIMRDVAKASDAVKLSLAGNPEALGKAAAQAKALGMNLEQIDKIAESLLDFETSISNELSAELLTGRDLNLEQARLYAINNDMAGVAREINKNFGSAAEFSKMNRLQQEAAAKAVGMSREELARTLVDQEALKGLSGKQAEDAQAALDAARARGMSESEIAQQSIDNLMKQQSVQERLNNLVEKLKELFIGIAGPIMQIISPMVDVLFPILSSINLLVGGISKFFTQIGDKISSIIGPLGTIGKILKVIAGLVIVFAAYQAAVAVATFLSATVIGGFLAPFAAIAAGAAVAAAGFGLLNSIKDGMISPDGGLIVSGKKGTYSLDKNDTVIAGTELGKKSPIPSYQDVQINPVGEVNSSAGRGTYQIDAGKSTKTETTSIDISPLINELKASREELVSIKSELFKPKPMVVKSENYMNGTPFGTATAMAVYTTQ